MLYVIGSGPAGVAAAHALLSRGYKVTLLDAGIHLPQEKKAILDQLASQKQWDTTLLNKITGTIDIDNRDGVPKTAYASQFSTDREGINISIEQKDAVCMPSFARGGLSNIWGAAMMAYDHSDLKDWPIDLTDLLPYYKKVAELIPLSTAKGRQTLDTHVAGDIRSHFIPSQQASHLLQHWDMNDQELEKHGITFSTAKLAVAFESCRYCKQCLYGCPAGLIYRSSDTLTELMSNPSFLYLKDIVVQRISEEDNSITIHAAHRLTQENLCYTGHRVFLAAGAVMTSKVLMTSCSNIRNSTLTIRDSQHFMLPCLMYRRIPKVAHEDLFTMCQLVLQLKPEENNRGPVSLQLYTYMDFFESFLKNKFGIFYPLFKGPLRLLLERMIVIQGYLSSDNSNTVELSIDQHDQNSIMLRSREKKSVTKQIKRIAWFLFRHKHKLGFVPLFPFARVSLPGKSNHYGASIPSSSSRIPLHSNVMGVPYGFNNLHVVDSSVFPSISSKPITYTVMANAYRIASECEI